MHDTEGPAPSIDVRGLRAAARNTAGTTGSAAGGRHARTEGTPAISGLVVRVLLGAAALALAALAGVRWADATALPAPRAVPASPLMPPASEPSGADPSLTPTPARTKAEEPVLRRHGSAEDWAVVLRELDERRTRAFARADGDGLTAVYLRGSPALREDQADVARLAAAGLRARGLRMIIGSVRVRETAPGKVVLEVSDRMSPYDIVDRSGRVVRAIPGRGDRPWRVTLVPARDAVGEWRISRIVQGA